MWSRAAADERWALVLGGGAGTRLLPTTRLLAGDERPKQFCAVLGGETLLEQTRDRVGLLVDPSRTMFVLVRGHEPFFGPLLADVPASRLVVQPSNAGTAAALLYSLLRLRRRSPSASVAVFPSDHYVSDARHFMSFVDAAYEQSRRRPDQIVLLGITPQRAETDYGWIEPSDAAGFGYLAGARRVRQFWEKPSPERARALHDGGALWNSFVMVGRVRAFLWTLRLAQPDLFRRFAEAETTLGTSGETEAIARVYGGLAPVDVSRDVLARRPQDLSVLPVAGVEWSDLGDPGRLGALREARRRAGSRPGAPALCHTAPDDGRPGGEE
jgi:mannose-1-phosphate guanylyltransferase